MNLIKREKSEDTDCCRLDSQRPFLNANARPLRRRSRSGPSAVLDRSAIGLAMATLPDTGGSVSPRPTGPSHLRLLHRHCTHHLGAVSCSHHGIAHPPIGSRAFSHCRWRRIRSSCYCRNARRGPRKSSGKFTWHHPKSQDQNSQNDFCHCLW